MSASFMQNDLDLVCVNTLRALTVDAVEVAQSGHPGTPIALAPVIYSLWQEFLRFDPADPAWPNRDRFVLSVGHASMLLYSLFYLSGVKAVNEKYENTDKPAITLDDIRTFRHLGSKCTGHPEREITSGVETTTGALGQGVATAVGMAIAGQWLASYFNRPGFELFNYRVYAMCGDGCIMEGVASEAASLAGHLKLSNLCWIYDNNHITNEGSIQLSFSEDVATRFIAYGWNVTRVADANDLEMLHRAFTVAQETTHQPTLIIVDSHIGWGAPHKHDSNAAHAGPLGKEEARLAKQAWGWQYHDKDFFVPPGVVEHFAQHTGERGRHLHRAWKDDLHRYANEYPTEAQHLKQLLHDELPADWEKPIAVFFQ